ncbi:MAG: hypothetical protein ISQ85_06505, partial [Planktomarina sp.]|nr:hypothetical protein [Planktomarina sp.]
IISDYIIARRSDTTYPAHLMDRADKLTKAPTHDNVIANDIASFFRGVFKPEVVT